MDFLSERHEILQNSAGVVRAFERQGIWAKLQLASKVANLDSSKSLALSLPVIQTVGVCVSLARHCEAWIHRWPRSV